ncbi:MAG: GTP-binding protein [Parcubacteria group bacterium]|jgi:bifunctional enzyme CysN/CysC/sulfate adenylyltransferase subunit 1
MLPAITIIGGVDSGKSTLIGNLLMETKSIPQNLIQKVKDFCVKEKLVFEPAYLVDYMREEITLQSTRERALAELKIGAERVLIIDTPGQMTLSQKMISGLSEANIVVILLDMTDRDVKKYHYYLKLASLLGFSEIIVAVNKLDVFGYKKDEYEKFLKKFRIKEGDNFYVIPISALKNEDLTKKSKLLAWCKEDNLLAVLNKILEKEEKKKKARFLMPVQSILEIGKEKIALGAVLEGKVSVGDEIKIFDGVSSKKTEIKKLYHNDKKASQVFAGENAGLVVSQCGLQIKRGHIFHNLPEKAFSEKVEAGLYILKPFDPDSPEDYSVRILTGSYGLKKLEVRKRFDFQLAPVNNLAGKLSSNEFCDARMILDRKIAVTKNISARRFAIEDKKGNLVAIGMQTSH